MPTTTYNSLSVIVPAFKAKETLAKTLQSIHASLQYFAATPLGAGVKGRIVVVDDCSPDTTVEVARSLAASAPSVTVLRTDRNRGPGAARNLGVRTAPADLLFFCDADDLFFENHIHTCFKMMVDDVRIDAVKTSVFAADPVHPHFEKVLQTSLPLNLCVKRACHEFVEGFPEHEAYLQLRGGEDTTYILAIGRFFRVWFTNLKTVEYIRRPGNAFDRQLPRFQHAPGSIPDTRTPQELSAERAVEKHRNAHLEHLQTKWDRLLNQRT